MTEHILSMIGLAKKAGQVAIGEEPVGAVSYTHLTLPTILRV